MRGLFPKKGGNNTEKGQDNEVKSILFDRFNRQYEILVAKMNNSFEANNKKCIKSSADNRKKYSKQ